MSRAVWKFEVQATGRQTIEMPLGAQLLSAQQQGESVQLWALVNPAASRVGRKIVVLATGETVDLVSDGLLGSYISTFQLSNGLVFHLFDAGEA